MIKQFIIAKYLCSCLQQNKFEAYIVGGAVRDLLLDRTPKDFDICTNAKIEEIISCIPYPAKINQDYFVCDFKIEGIHFEVTSFRDESEMKTRKDSPMYGNIFSDCQRRDFTVNSLYWNPITNEIKDPCKTGVSDVKNKKIRTVRDTDIVLTEDPIRIVRAISLNRRFNMEITFDIKKFVHLIDFNDPKTKERLK